MLHILGIDSAAKSLPGIPFDSETPGTDGIDSEIR